MSYSRSKLGEFMYDIIFKGSKFLSHHIWLYFILNFTWGIVMTLLGYIIAFVLLLFRQKPFAYQKVFYFKIGKLWGGVSLGMMFIRDKNERDTSIEPHEYGHSFQNALLGPLFIFLVAIPSFIRYWYQVIREKHNKINKPYEYIWFEGCATDMGEYIKEKK